MTPTESLALCRLAKAACPQQAVDEFTPDAWHLLLEDLRFEDAKLALIEVCKRQPFVAPAEIRAEVSRIRKQRLLDHPLPPVPAGFTDAEELSWRRQMQDRIADGEVFPIPELPAATTPPAAIRALATSWRSDR